MDWQAKRLEGKIFAVRTGTLYLFGQLTYLYTDKSRFIGLSPTPAKKKKQKGSLIAEDAEAGSRESGRPAGDVLLQRGLEIDDGVGTELARLFLDDPQKSLIIKFFERRPSLGETFVTIG